MMNKGQTLLLGIIIATGVIRTTQTHDFSFLAMAISAGIIAFLAFLEGTDEDTRN